MGGSGMLGPNKSALPSVCWPRQTRSRWVGVQHAEPGVTIFNACLYSGHAIQRRPGDEQIRYSQSP